MRLRLLVAAFAIVAACEHSPVQMQSAKEKVEQMVIALKYTPIATNCSSMGVAGVRCAVRVQEAPMPLHIECSGGAEWHCRHK